MIPIAQKVMANGFFFLTQNQIPSPKIISEITGSCKIIL
jgi:hypothetical protein